MNNDKKYIIASVIIILIIIAGWRFGIFKKAGQPIDNQNQEAGLINLVLENMENGIILGDKDAPITMIEFTNFLCSHCADFAIKTLPTIEEKYIKSGQLKLAILISPPLELGEAALCALEQNKFEQYHNYLFENQDKISEVNDLKIFAENVGMNKDKFSKCLDSKKYENTANSWFNESQQRGVEGTPTFFIYSSNNTEDFEKIVGAAPFEDFEKIIKKYLASEVKTLNP